MAHEALDAMRQPDLLGGDAGVLLDDASGRIEYLPALLDDTHAHLCFEQLLADVPWQDQRREMYGREVAVPRLTASYRLDQPGLPDAVFYVSRRVQARIDAPFNAVGLNLYRDCNDSVAPHNDHLYDIAPHQPIALVSLGATRQMVIRARTPPHGTLKIELQDGSLLLMSYETQLHYDHGIPKERAATGPRISLAFRVRA